MAATGNVQFMYLLIHGEEEDSVGLRQGCCLLGRREEDQVRCDTAKTVAKWRHDSLVWPASRSAEGASGWARLARFAASKIQGRLQGDAHGRQEEIGKIIEGRGLGFLPESRKTAAATRNSGDQIRCPGGAIGGETKGKPRRGSRYSYRIKRH